MARLVAIAALLVVAAVVGPAASQSCQCDGPIECFQTQRDCLNGINSPSDVFADGDAAHCLDVRKKVYRCANDANYCRSRDTCDVLLTIERCQVPTYFMCCHSPSNCRQGIGYQFSANNAQEVCNLFNMAYYHCTDEPSLMRRACARSFPAGA